MSPFESIGCTSSADISMLGAGESPRSKSGHDSEMLIYAADESTSYEIQKYPRHWLV